MTYGENYVRPKGSIHAEQDCINKLPVVKGSRPVKVSILSVRVNRLGQLMSAKPCFRCIYMMNKIVKKGYKITSVYYTDSRGQIINCSLDTLNKEECKHISGRYR